MQKINKLTGLVIRSTDYGESDKLLDVLTVEQGRCLITSKGARKSTGKLAPCSHILYYGEFTVYDKNGHYWLKESNCLVDFYQLDCSIEMLSLYAYFIELIQLTTFTDKPDIEILRLMLNTLYFSQNKGVDDSKISFIKSTFEIKLLSLCGFAPAISYCSKCNEKKSLYYDFDTDESLCLECSGENVVGYYLPKSCILAIEYIESAPIERVFSYSIDHEAIASLSVFSERFLIAELETKPKSLNYFNKITQN